MNFLAHLHLASLAGSSLLGNLSADFIRGDPYLQFDKVIADGIMMHRRLDRLIDQRNETKKAKQLFSADYIRVAPIFLDIIWDHFLARNWNDFSVQPLAQFVEMVRQEINTQLFVMPAIFQNVNKYLWQENWLERYADLAFIQQVLTQMAIRRPKLSQLASSFTEIEQHYQPLRQLFYQFYPEFIQQASEKKF